MTAMGRLFERLAAVAKANPLATRREGYSAERLATISDDNRWICFPYPRLMNANAIIDQAAAVLMTSVGRRANGASRRSAGCSCTAAPTAPTPGWCPSASARRLAGHQGLRAHRARHGRQERGRRGGLRPLQLLPLGGRGGDEGDRIAEDDPRPISVTGGLPFFGGPGNNYVTHSIAEMMNVVRKKPGSFGMVTANGNYLTKHSAGLYSTEPTKGPWRREDPKKFQAELEPGRSSA